MSAQADSTSSANSDQAFAQDLHNPRPKQSAVAVLAKAPSIGKVKTRMRAALSDAQALALHRWCLDELNQRLLPQVRASCAELDHQNASLLFVTRPDPMWAEFNVSAPPWVQVSGHLGARMWAALCESFDWLAAQQTTGLPIGSSTEKRERQDAVILLGTDSPHLDPNELAEGLAELSASLEPRALIGPAEDGGYYTIGCNRAALNMIAPLFSEEIKWGTSEVLAETERRAQRHGVKLRRLSPSFDLDRPADLDKLMALDAERAERLQVRLSPHPLAPPHEGPIASRYQRALASLFGLTRFGERQDLSAPRAINAALGDPLGAYRNILVGGTNGKGSTCAALLGLAKTCKTRAGCFTSPHLISFRERIRVGDALISPSRVIEGVEVIFAAAERAQITLSFFEAAWALAAWHFAQEEVEWVIWEVGLGGRLDATNICEPEVSAIVSVSLDHTHILGDTLDAIASEKAPIFRERGAALTAARGEALDALRRYAPAHLRTLEELVNLDELDHSALRLASAQSSGLMSSAAHGRRNLALAWAIAEAAGWRPPVWETTPDQGAPWWAQVIWPGRLERLHNVWLDCAHNPDSATHIATWLDEQSARGSLDASLGSSATLGEEETPRGEPRARHLIIGMSADKDQAAVLTALASRSDRITFTSPLYPRCADAETLRECYERVTLPNLTAQGLTPPEISVIPSIADALRARDPSALTLVTGSCFAVGEARAWLLGVPFPEGGIVTSAR